MNKKTKNVLILVIVAVFALFLFASCNNSTNPGIFEYSQSNLSGIGKLVRWMRGWVGNYGWTVVVFTVFLKLLTLPLDFWSRYASRKSTLKMQQMQPVIEGIDKRYGANTQRANEEKQKLYKKQGFSMMSSCLPMIVSMVIFIFMLRGLQNYSTFSSVENFKKMYETYYDVYAEEILKDDELADIYNNGFTDDSGTPVKGYLATLQEAGGDETNEAVKVRSQIQGITAAIQYEESGEKCAAAEQAALEAVKEVFKENNESWLWIKSVWQPDTWADIMQPYKGSQFTGNGLSTTITLTDKEQTVYNKIRSAVLETGGHGKNGSWNGLMIMPILSIGLSFLSMFVSQRLERKNRQGQVVEQNAQQKTTNRMMMIMMPLMMAFFGFSYTGAFAIYMVGSYSLSILNTVWLRYPVEKLVAKSLNKEDKKNKSNKASYMR